MNKALALISILCLVGCQPAVEELTKLHGKKESEVVDILGKPTITNVLTLQHGVTLPELYIEIHNTYDPSDPNIDNIKIKEFRWDRKGYTEAVFMHHVDDTWSVLESCRWKDGIAF